MMFRIWTVVVCGLWLAGCASTGFRPSPFPVPAEGHLPERMEPLPGGVDGYAVAGTALELRGTPYRAGGADPSGFDCSGFIWYVFARHGLGVPRTVADQSQVGEKVEADALQAGDLVFFRTDGRSISHVGLSIGGDEFVHAPSSRGEVRVERLGSSYWASRFAGARRVR